MANVRLLDLRASNINLFLVASSPPDLSKGILKIRQVGATLRVSIEPSKSQVLWLSGRPNQPKAVISDGHPITEVEAVKCLEILVGIGGQLNRWVT